VLTVKATIKQLIRISPVSLRFVGQEGTVQTQSVVVAAQEEKSLIIKPGEFNLKDKITYQIEETEKGKAFKIIFTNIPQPAGHFNGFLKLLTNYDDKPEISISIYGDFLKKTEENEKK
jgi:hypothetical protein